MKDKKETAQEVPVQEQHIKIVIDGKQIAKFVICELRNRQKQDNIRIIPV